MLRIVTHKGHQHTVKLNGKTFKSVMAVKFGLPFTPTEILIDDQPYLITPSFEEAAKAYPYVIAGNEIGEEYYAMVERLPFVRLVIRQIVVEDSQGPITAFTIKWEDSTVAVYETGYIYKLLERAPIQDVSTEKILDLAYALVEMFLKKDGYVVIGKEMSDEEWAQEAPIEYWTVTEGLMPEEIF